MSMNTSPSTRRFNRKDLVIIRHTKMPSSHDHYLHKGRASLAMVLDGGPLSSYVVYVAGPGLSVSGPFWMSNEYLVPYGRIDGHRDYDSGDEGSSEQR